MSNELWTVHEGEGPVIGTAIHDGHLVRAQLADAMAISDSSRLREEDCFSSIFIAGLPTRIIVSQSRFVIDLNRAEEEAIYRKPEQAWGLQVWREGGLSEHERKHSIEIHRRYYAMLEAQLKRVKKQVGKFVVLDMHSYNHRRDGPSSSPTPANKAPEINLGTYSMDREKWRHVVDPFMEFLRQQKYLGRKLDVRENIAFEGRGQQAKFVHETFPEHGCAIALEVKKFYMDEWSGRVSTADLQALKILFERAVPVLIDALKSR